MAVRQAVPLVEPVLVDRDPDQRLQPGQVEAAFLELVTVRKTQLSVPEQAHPDPYRMAVLTRRRRGPLQTF